MQKNSEAVPIKKIKTIPAQKRITPTTKILQNRCERGGWRMVDGGWWMVNGEW